MASKFDLSRGFISNKKFNQMFIVTNKLAYNMLITYKCLLWPLQM